MLVGNHRWNKAQTWSDAPRTPDVLLFQRPTSHYPKGSSCPAVSWLLPWITCPLPLPPGSPSAPYPAPPLALHPSSLMWWWSPGPASAGSLPHDVRMLKPLFCLSQYTTVCSLVFLSGCLYLPHPHCPAASPDLRLTPWTVQADRVETFGDRLLRPQGNFYFPLQSFYSWQGDLLHRSLGGTSCYKA